MSIAASQRLFLDESGDHTIRSILAANWDKRYLCLFGCSFDINIYRRKWQPDFEEFKIRHFGGDPEDPVILHREDVKAKRGPFKVLLDPKKNEQFNEELLNIASKAPFRAFAVVIDKLNTVNKHFGPVGAHAYHVGLLGLMERYCHWLKIGRCVGDILAESRGGREDDQLKAAYIAVHTGGTRYHDAQFFKKYLTSGEIKIKPKTQNIAALQLADILAYPAKRRVLENYNLAPPCKDFTKMLADAIEKKYNRNHNGQVPGYGKILLS